MASPEFRETSQTTMIMDELPSVPEEIIKLMRRRFAATIAADLTEKFRVTVTADHVLGMELDEPLGSESAPSADTGPTPVERQKRKYTRKATTTPADIVKEENRARGLRAAETRIANWLRTHPGFNRTQAKEAMMAQARRVRSQRAEERRKKLAQQRNRRSAA
jgi:hypothetical protein